MSCYATGEDCPHPIGNSGSGSGGGEGREKGKEGSLCWSVQAVLVSTLSTGRKATDVGVGGVGH